MENQLKKHDPVAVQRVNGHHSRMNMPRDVTGGLELPRETPISRFSRLNQLITSLAVEPVILPRRRSGWNSKLRPPAQVAGLAISLVLLWGTPVEQQLAGKQPAIRWKTDGRERTWEGEKRGLERGKEREGEREREERENQIWKMSPPLILEGKNTIYSLQPWILALRLI